MKDVYKYGLSGLGGMGFFGYCAIMAYFMDMRASKNKLEAQNRFEELLDLADVDGNGELSKIEKDLLTARLNLFNANHSKIWNEEDVMSPNIRDYDLGTLVKTIEEYNK